MIGKFIQKPSKDVRTNLSYVLYYMSGNVGQFLQCHIDLILQNDDEYSMDYTCKQRENVKENRNQNDKY